jgi:hypothetical protein
MIQRMRAFTVILPLSLAFVGLGLGLAQAGDEAKPCRATTFKIPAVKSACEAGGQKAVQKLMKAAVDKAKAAGTAMKCLDCHNDLKAYELKGSDPVGQIKPWL